MTQINLPKDLKLEVLCLGAVLTSIDAANEAFSFLDDSDFFDADHKKIYSLMKSTFSEEIGCNVSTMNEKMEKQEGNFSRDYLLYLHSNAWLGMPYEDYFKAIKNLSGLRKSCFAAQDLLFKASAPNAVYDDVMAYHHSSLLKTMGINNSTMTPLEVFKSFRKDMSFVDYSLWRRDRYLRGLPVYDGVSSGYKILDETIGSFQNSKLYYIGARTSMGKTTLILNFIAEIMKKNKIGIFSLEMDTYTIVEKLICLLCDIKYSRFSVGNCTIEEIERVKEQENTLIKNNVFIEDESGMNLSKLTARAKRMKKTHEIEILFIDYLTLVRSDNKHPTKHMMVDEVSKGLQNLSKELKIPIVCLAQLNRTAAGAANERPSLSQFRESGSIEEDADACLLIHRPDYYDRNSKPGIVELIIAKNRIMGTLKTIDYSCNYALSDRYHELQSIQEQLKKEEEKQAEKRFDDLLSGENS